MDNRHWPWLLLLGALGLTLPGTAAAQTSAGSTLKPLSLPLHFAPSHRPLSEDVGAALTEESLALRLGQLRDLHEAQDIARKLAQDKRFLEKLRSLSPEEK